MSEAGKEGAAPLDSVEMCILLPLKSGVNPAVAKAVVETLTNVVAQVAENLSVPQVDLQGGNAGTPVDEVLRNLLNLVVPRPVFLRAELTSGPEMSGNRQASASDPED